MSAGVFDRLGGIVHTNDAHRTLCREELAAVSAAACDIKNGAASNQRCGIGIPQHMNEVAARLPA